MEKQKSGDKFFMADKCESAGEFDTALKIYKEILKNNPENAVAKNGADRVLKRLAEHIYYQTNANMHLKEGTLELHWEELVFNAYNGTGAVYKLGIIEEMKVYLGRLKFVYNGKKVEISCRHPKKWKQYIQMAQNGSYPD